MSTPVGSYASLDAVVAATPAKDASPGFSVMGPKPKILFSTQGVPPPSTLYVTSDDTIELRVFNLNSAVIDVDLRLRVLTPEGEIKFDIINLHNPPSNGVRAAVQMHLSEGFLLSCSVVGVPAGVGVGDCFVQVVLNRPPGVLGPTAIQLISDYCVLSHFPTWPGGTMVKSIDAPGSFKTIVGTVPAPGAFFSVTCPPNTRWTVMSVAFEYDVSVAAGNRNPFLKFLTPTSQLVWVAPFTVSQSPGTSLSYFAGTSAGFAVSASGLNLISSLPEKMLMQAGDVILAGDNSIQAGDQFNNIFVRVEQWVDV